MNNVNDQKLYIAGSNLRAGYLALTGDHWSFSKYIWWCFFNGYITLRRTVCVYWRLNILTNVQPSSFRLPLLCTNLLPSRLSFTYKHVTCSFIFFIETKLYWHLFYWLSRFHNSFLPCENIWNIWKHHRTFIQTTALGLVTTICRNAQATCGISIKNTTCSKRWSKLF